jgi:elongator complex protein 5
MMTKYLTGKLLIIDNLNTLASDPSTAANLPALLSSFLSPTVSLVAVYHADIPIPPSITLASPYTPQPLTVLKYLATTILTTYALNHILAAKAARERSVAEPVFGLAEEVEGILLGLGGNAPSGLVLEMEYRRKSGRGVREWYFLPHPALQKPEGANVQAKNRFRETVMLLEDHEAYRRPTEDQQRDDSMDVTFELGLTDRQRQAREGVVLPYFDAQNGGGDGGRILYDMGEEDDFDEEEDEI